MTFKRIAVDTSKAVFTVHGIDETDRVVLRRDLSRARFQTFVISLDPTEFVLEASGGAHHWGRLLELHGHRVRLIPPQYVKPFVKRSKNDRADAQAICEAAGRPGMSVVPVRSVDRQAEAMILQVRERLVLQRTQLINSLRGHATEFGIVAARGCSRIPELMKRVRADRVIPSAAIREMERLRRCIEALDAEISELDRELADAAKDHEVACRLMGVPGIGPISAMTLVLTWRRHGSRVGVILQPGSDWCRASIPRAASSGSAGSARKATLGSDSCSSSVQRRRSGTRAGQPDCIAMAARIAGAQAAEARGGRPGQQDGPRRVGHDGARNSLSPASGHGLILLQCHEGRATTKMTIGRTDEREHAG